jgi:hypothetical protein
MNKRNVATVLWFITGWTGGALFFGFFNLPELLALVPAVGIAWVVRTDPNHAIWVSEPPKRRVRPINEVAAELDRRNEGAGVLAESRTPR